MPIRIADGLDMDASEAATQTLGAIAAKGGGKSYLAGKFVEALYDAGAPFLVLDPIGNWSSLTVASDGKSPGLSVVVVGGDRGDVLLQPEDAAGVGQLLLERGISAILDVSELSKTKRKGYVADLLEAVYQAARKKRSPYMVVLEEAQVFAPQHVQKGEERMLGAVTDVVRLGRNYGLGSMLVTQRPQSVSKEVLNQIECLFVGQLRGPQERKAIAGWVTEQGADVTAQLKETPALSPGEFFCWSPSWLRVFRKVKILPKRTFDGSRTPTLGAQALELVKTKRGVSEAAKLLADIGQRGGTRADGPELSGRPPHPSIHLPPGEVKSTELGERAWVSLGEYQALQRAYDQLSTQFQELEGRWMLLQQKVHVLDRELDEQDSRRRSVVTWSQDFRRQVTTALDWLDTECCPAPPKRELSAANGAASSEFDRLDGNLHQAPKEVSPAPSVAELLNRSPLARHAPRGAGGDHKLEKGDRAVLGVLAWQKGPIPKARLALLSGYSASGGGFNNVLSRLRTAGRIEGSGELVITSEGRQVAPAAPALPTEPHELFEWWSGHPSVDTAMRRILRALWLVRTRAVTKDALAQLSGSKSSTNGSWNNALSRCRTLGLVEGRGKEKLRLVEGLR